MELSTAGSFVTYVSKIEQESAALYSSWARQHDELKELFLAIAEDNKKNERAIRGAYYGVVSDALETNFCFKGLQADLEVPHLCEKASPLAVLEAGIRIERDLRGFYIEAAQRCKAFLPDVSRAAERVAKMREGRLKKLRSIQE